MSPYDPTKLLPARQARWDRRYLRLAKYWAEENSKDPSTKVGAVIVNRRNRVVGLGYNGFPEGVKDTAERLNDRPTKYKFVVHAEANAILNAVADVHGCTIYIWPLFTCHECAKLVIQSGIVRVVTPDQDREWWADSMATAIEMYQEAGVDFHFMDWREPKRGSVPPVSHQPDEGFFPGGSHPADEALHRHPPFIHASEREAKD